MIILEYIIVGLVIGLAIAYLTKTFWPKTGAGGCGCSNSACKIRKNKLVQSKAPGSR